jgi:autotransporter passenger strand-loop-strand repeat protein
MPTTVTSGQTLTVSAGQTSSGVTVLNGGSLIVASGGTAIATVLSNGAEEFVSSGGTLDIQSGASPADRNTRRDVTLPAGSVVSGRVRATPQGAF